MNADVKAQWVAALRSGDYPQTTGLLHRVEVTSDAPVGFCCLGVLCELAVQAGVIEWDQTADERDMGVMGYRSFYRKGKPYLETALLPREVIEWAGLETTYGWSRGDGASNVDDLPDLNDQGVSFAEIADIIEREA